MKSATSSARPVLLSIFALCATVLAMVWTTSCGGSMSKTPPPPTFSGSTSVTVLVSSTGNDQLTRFDLAFQSLTLTGQSGNAVTLSSSAQPAEFMHLNGGIEPLTTATVPQGIYTSAAATLASAVFVCLAQVPGGGLGIANYSIVNQGPTVSLASPITITGKTMTLLLDLQVSSSATLPTCWTTPSFQGFSMAPMFNLTPVALSNAPTNSGNGKVSGLVAQIAAVGTTPSSLTLTVAGQSMGTRTVSASSDSTTEFQGVSGASALTPGMFVNLDGAIQPDGSLLATRIEVEDSSAANDSSGPVMFVDNVVPAFELYGRTELGSLLTIGSQNGIYFDIPYFDAGSSTAFQISGQFANLQNLPFVPSFNASNMVAGQNVDVTSANFVLGGGLGTPTNTVTLVPQTVDGQVVGSGQSGGFTDYTVSLASYDLFPTLAVQQGQTTLLTNPSQIEIYVDSNTQQLNTQALAVGSTMRFYGLVFNDNGTLRMDCARINDGVPFSAPANSNTRMQAAQIRAAQVQASQVQTIRRQGLAGSRQIPTTMTRSQ